MAVKLSDDYVYKNKRHLQLKVNEIAINAAYSDNPCKRASEYNNSGHNNNSGAAVISA